MRLANRIADAQVAWDKEYARWLEGYRTDFNGGWVPKDKHDLGLTYAEYAGERPSLIAKTDSSDIFVFPTVRPKARPSRKPYKRNPAKADMNAEVLRRHDAGERHTKIAADLGITRERVRQIVGIGGGTPRRVKPAPKSIGALEKKFAEEAPVLGLSAIELAQRYAVTTTTIYEMAKSSGIKLQKFQSNKMAKLKRAAGHVLMGKSYYQAAFCVGLSVVSVTNYCRKIGVRSRYSEVQS